MRHLSINLNEDREELKIPKHKYNNSKHGIENKNNYLINPNDSNSLYSSTAE